MDEHWARLNALYVQCIPTSELTSRIFAVPEWHSLSAQERLQRILLNPEAKLLPNYRHRVLQKLIRALEARRSEINEEILYQYILGKSASLESDSFWHYRYFQVSSHSLLSLRTANSMGGGVETGGLLWSAALALSAWAWKNPSVFTGHQILELGAGTFCVKLNKRLLDQSHSS